MAWLSVVVVATCLILDRNWLEELRQDPEITVIAHRGASDEAPENTIAAIEAAIEAGADMVEIDVQHHPSGELYLFHDKDLRRMAGKTSRLREMDPEDIARTDAGSWFGPEFSGERIPTLADALEACRGRIGLMVELKSYGPRAPLAEAAIAAVEKADMASSVCLMSFDPELVIRLDEMRPDWRIGLVTSSHPEASDFAGIDFIAVDRGILSRDLTRRAGVGNIPVYGWTLNRPIDMSSAVSRGATGIITDRPRTARRVLDERARLNPAERLTLDLLSRIALIHDLLQS